MRFQYRRRDFGPCVGWRRAEISASQTANEQWQSSVTIQPERIPITRRLSKHAETTVSNNRNEVQEARKGLRTSVEKMLQREREGSYVKMIGQPCFCLNALTSKLASQLRIFATTLVFHFDQGWRRLVVCGGLSSLHNMNMHEKGLHHSLSYAACI